MRLIRKKTPTELFDLARFGGEAETVRRVIGQFLDAELDRVVTQISHISPDIGEYARLAGQVHTIQKLKKTLEINAAEGKEAAKQLGGI